MSQITSDPTTVGRARHGLPQLRLGAMASGGGAGAPRRHGRTVSGRYRGVHGPFELELRVDLDGPRPSMVLSGDYTVTGGATTAYLGSWIVESPAVSVTARGVVAEGPAVTTWPARFTRVRVTVPLRGADETQDAATVTWLDDRGAPSSGHRCSWESPLLRSIGWERDWVAGPPPPARVDGGGLLRTSDVATPMLSVPAVFAQAGIDLVTGGTPSVVTTAARDRDARWDEAQLHAAMVAALGRRTGAPRRRIYTLTVPQFVDPSVCSVRYVGTGGDLPRGQALAVFRDTVGRLPSASTEAGLHADVHALGHCLGLAHPSWGGLEDPTSPLSGPGGFGDVSWMDPPSVRRDAVTPDRDCAAGIRLPRLFTPDELRHLRHGFGSEVNALSCGVAAGSTDVDPREFADQETDRSGLALDLRGAPGHLLGEPVVVELRLSGTTHAPVRTHGRLHPRDGLVRIAVQGPSGHVRLYRPLMPRCVEAIEHVVLHAGGPACHESVYLGYGLDGFVFDQVGSYRLRAVYLTEDGRRVVSPVLRLRVSSPHTAADEDVAALLLADGQGELLYLLGSDAPSLAGADAAMDELLERYPKHRLSVFARLVKGINDARVFKRLDADRTLVVRHPRAEQAQEQLRAVIAASTGSGGVDNLTLNLVIRCLARAELAAGNADRAAATLDAMPGLFRRKGLTPQVVDVIAEQARREKADLLPAAEPLR